MLHLVLISKTPEEIANIKKYYNNFKWDILLQPEMLNRFICLASYNLTGKQYAEIQKKYGKGSEVAFQANVGKKMIKYMNNAMKLWLIDAGAHIAHDGPLRPTKAWLIDKKDSEKLFPNCSNFFSVAHVEKL